MKKSIVMCFSLVMMVVLLAACGSNEVDSRDEANRVLLSANSVIAECEKSMDDFETHLKTVSTKDLNNIEKRLSESLDDIHSCDSYKDVEDVAPKYEKAIDYHGRAVKHLEQLRKQAGLEVKK